MKKYPLLSLSAFLAVTSALTSVNAFADAPPPPLNEVTFRLTAEQWVQTQTAKISVGIHATLNKKTLGQMREQIMSNLNKIAQGKWHITNFERSQDSSGLETLYVEAEARVNESLLTGVNAEALALSEPGIKYKINNIDFSPSKMDIENAKKELRKTIYHDASAEISTLNTLYPEQKYVLHDIRFETSDYTNNGMRAMAMVMTTGGSQTQSEQAPAVSNLVTLAADVNIASQGIPLSGKPIP